MTDVMTETIVEQAMATLEIIELENLFEENLECDSHQSHVCTHEVTHRASMTCHTRSALWCASRYQLYVSVDEYMTCGDCHNFITECWKVVAI